MMPGYKRLGRDKIDDILRARLEALDIPPETLEQPTGSGTLRELICSLVEETLSEVSTQAQNELYERQQAGREKAQRRGVSLGRPSKKCSDKRFDKIRRLYEEHDISAEEAAQRLHVSVSTFYRWLRESREQAPEICTQ